MKIKNKVLLSVEESDLINGHFENLEVEEISDKCLILLKGLKSLYLPKVKKIGNDCLHYNASLTTVSLPAATTFGNYCLRSNASLTTVILRKKEYKVKYIDGHCFVIELSKKSKGILIHTGYNILSMNDGILSKQNCYVAEKENYYAHGETIKKAISDLQFKLVCERLKKDPINADTLITINHYRIITGACEFGVKSWMEQNKISIDEIKASELLPILEKTGAYGFENFKKLVTL